jgi:hypothetical protein
MQRAIILASAISAHLLAIVNFGGASGQVDLSVLREQERLTLITLSKPIQSPAAKEPEMPAEASKVANQPHGAPPAELEWTRVTNWRPKATGTAADAGIGKGGGRDPTLLLAGLGAQGPAGQQDGVADPYAGASPIWAANGARSDLLLMGAPNPAVLEQIRQRVSKAFRGMSGYARLTVVVDQQGVVVNVVRTDTNLPEAARQFLEESIVSRVVSGHRAKAGPMDLPEIRFN